MPRKAARRDQNEDEIVVALRTIGATVYRIDGKDVVDLLVGFRGVNYAIEIKMPKSKLKPGQQEWHDNWKGQCAVVRTVEEALQVIGAIDNG